MTFLSLIFFLPNVFWVFFLSSVSFSFSEFFFLSESLLRSLLSILLILIFVFSIDEGSCFSDWLGDFPDLILSISSFFSFLLSAFRILFCSSFDSGLRTTPDFFWLFSLLSIDIFSGIFCLFVLRVWDWGSVLIPFLYLFFSTITVLPYFS